MQRGADFDAFGQASDHFFAVQKAFVTLDVPAFHFDAGIPHAVIGPPSMFGVVLGENAGDVHDFRTYLETDTDLYEAIGMELSQRGVQPDADGREPWFLCYALSDEDVAETLTVFEASVKAVKRKG